LGSQRSQLGSQRSAFSIPASKTLNNRSSVTHNIITGDENKYSYNQKPGLMDTQVSNRKLGITEIKDLAGPNKVHAHPDYQKAFKENPNNFKK
jgi:hypothetical protein